MVISLAVAGVVCGFFGELWNHYSFPKWVYHTPGAGFLHIFEMPLLGYGGYVPFALELYALKNFLGLLGGERRAISNWRVAQMRNLVPLNLSSEEAF